MNYKKLFSLKNLYVGQLGEIKICKNEEVEWIPFKNNSFIIFSKKKKNRRAIEDKDAIDIFSGQEYYFYENYYGDKISGIFLNNSKPLSIYVNEQERKNGMISGRRIVEIFYNLNNPREKELESNEDEVLNEIFNIIQKLKDTNMVVENKDVTYEDLKILAQNYINDLIDIKTKNYNLDLTTETLIKDLTEEVKGKIQEIIKNFDTGISIYKNDLTRNLEKK